MPIALYSMADVFDTIRGGNLRGEMRWERQVLDALVTTGKTIYVTPSYFRSGSLCPPNVVTGLPDKLLPNTLIITHSPAMVDSRARANILNWFEHPPPVLWDYVKNFCKDNGPNRVTMTHCFVNSPLSNSLKGFVGPEYHWELPVPGTPEVDFTANNFDKKYLTWHHREFVHYLGEDLNMAKRIMFWIGHKLGHDQDMEFHILSGFEESETNRRFGMSIENYIRTAPYYNDYLSPYNDRVVIHPALGWDGVMKVMKETKLCVGRPLRYGGGPIEAATFGIPTIGLPGLGVFVHSPEYIGIDGRSWQFVNELEKLYTDEEYYKRKGDAFRNYAHENYTYAAFLKNLDKLTQTRFGFTLKEILEN